MPSQRPTLVYFNKYTQNTNPVGHADNARYLAGADKRMGELCETKNDRQRALAAYSRFVELWRLASRGFRLADKVQRVSQPISIRFGSAFAT